MMNQLINRTRAEHILSAFAEKKVLILGDLMLDEHVWGSVSRISPEAPVMVVDAEDFDARPGGAANVVANVRALGASAGVVGVVGRDREGAILRNSLKKQGVDVSGVVRLEKAYRTTRKIRIWASRRQQLVRVDSENREPLPKEAVGQIISNLESQIPTVDAIVISDYNKGVVTEEITSRAIALARRHGKVCLANAKPANAGLFRGATCVTLNQSEAEAVVGCSLDSRESIEGSLDSLFDRVGCDIAVITRGSRGLTVAEPGRPAIHIPAVPIEVYDVAGAGDTVISVLTLALTVGASKVESSMLANLAGGAVVRKVGVAACSTDDISALLDETLAR